MDAAEGSQAEGENMMPQPEATLPHNSPVHLAGEDNVQYEPEVTLSANTSQTAY